MRGLDIRSALLEAFEEAGYEWEIRGVVDASRRLYTLSDDTKLISKVFELVAFPVIFKALEPYGVAVETEERQTVYPDLTVVVGGEKPDKIAIDVKSTYRKPLGRAGFTLGSYTAYMRPPFTKNIRYPYNEYEAHWIVGFIYSRVANVVADLVPLGDLDSVTPPIKDVELVIQEKWRIASDKQTLNIQGGLLGGAGTITGNVSNGGQVSAGQSAGILSIAGSYTQTSGGALNIEILGPVPGSGFDQLKVSGGATLDGALNVSLGDTFVPGLGETFQVMTFASRSGSFFTINAPQCLQATLGASDVNIEAGTACPEADLSVTKTASAEPAVAGTELTYTLTVTNNGPATSTNTTLIDVLPPGVTFIGMSTTKGDCGGGPVTLVCNLGSLASGASATVTVLVEVDAATKGTFFNEASVVNAEPDLVAANNASTATTTVVTRADLSIAKSGSPDPVGPGETLTYTVTVSNAGPSAATGVTVTDSLPQGVTHVSTTPSQGVCTGSNPVSCDLGTIGSNDNATVTIQVTVGPEARGTLTNTASVTGNETDLVASNDTAVLVVPIPGVSAWGLLGMAGLMSAALWWRGRRRLGAILR